MTASARNPNRRRPVVRKRRPRRADIRTVRVPLVAYGVIALLIATVPPLRGFAQRGWNALTAALDASREADSRRLEVLGFAVRYGIDFHLALAIFQAAREEGLDPDLAFRLVAVESEFFERAVSSAGALGLTQLMPATAADLQPGITREEIFDRETNLRLGFRYLRTLLRVYDGDVTEALHAYNRGPGTVDRIRAGGGDPANGYADKVLGRGSNAYRGPALLD